MTANDSNVAKKRVLFVLEKKKKSKKEIEKEISLSLYHFFLKETCLYFFSNFSESDKYFIHSNERMRGRERERKIE